MKIQIDDLTTLANHLEKLTEAARRGHGWTYDDEVKMLRQTAEELKLLRGREATTMRLAKHIEELTKDKERLDWIEANRVDLSEVHGEWCVFTFPDAQSYTFSKTPREAIDKARAIKR
ncbi:MAG TPA: hypothetical protein VEC57_00215 [Candidatus Limnocylindrales bacterium]|nr:hypothetical protein [Candidatus Limnocylindrales bacterium]